MDDTYSVSHKELAMRPLSAEDRGNKLPAAHNVAFEI